VEHRSPTYPSLKKAKYEWRYALIVNAMFAAFLLITFALYSFSGMSARQFFGSTIALWICIAPVVPIFLIGAFLAPLALPIDQDFSERLKNSDAARASNWNLVLGCISLIAVLVYAVGATLGFFPYGLLLNAISGSFSCLGGVLLAKWYHGSLVALEQ
jgi:hypothetical protein